MLWAVRQDFSGVAANREGQPQLPRSSYLCSTPNFSSYEPSPLFSYIYYEADSACFLPALTYLLPILFGTSRLLIVDSSGNFRPSLILPIPFCFVVLLYFPTTNSKQDVSLIGIRRRGFWLLWLISCLSPVVRRARTGALIHLMAGVCPDFKDRNLEALAKWTCGHVLARSIDAVSVRSP